MDYHYYLRAYHADGSPPLLIWIRVFPRRRHRIFEHEDRCLEAKAVRFKVRLILALVPSPTQSPPCFTILRNCSYSKSLASIPVLPLASGYRPMSWEAWSVYRSRRNLNVKVLDFGRKSGPSGIRTLDTRIKSPVL